MVDAYLRPQGSQNSLSTTHGKWCINCFRAANGTCRSLLNAAAMNASVNADLNDPGIKARLAELTVTPLVLSPAEFGAYMTTEAAKWARVIKLANIKAE